VKKLILLSIIFIFSSLLTSSVKAKSASLYSPSFSGSFLVGDTFTVPIFLNTEESEINIIDLSMSSSTQSFFAEVISPYKVPSQKAGKYNSIVRAVDKTGNIKESKVRFCLMAPLITHIGGREI